MTKTASKLLDFGSVVVIVLTLVLFLVALFLKGFTHELLLEAGVFLVSVKLILLSCKNSLSARLADERLAQMQDALRRIEGQAFPPQ
ncbi:MAG: hypothetical protein ABSD96_20585 [Candidatus Korobacteraceae bacterium]|jgi:hypothetical protein